MQDCIFWMDPFFIFQFLFSDVFLWFITSFIASLECVCVYEGMLKIVCVTVFVSTFDIIALWKAKWLVRNRKHYYHKIFSLRYENINSRVLIVNQFFTMSVSLEIKILEEWNEVNIILNVEYNFKIILLKKQTSKCFLSIEQSKAKILLHKFFSVQFISLEPWVHSSNFVLFLWSCLFLLLW